MASWCLPGRVFLRHFLAYTFPLMIQGCEEQRIRRQIQTIINMGWTPVLEHGEPGLEGRCHWNTWKLPLFGGTDADAVFQEIKACRASHRRHCIRIVGFNALLRTRGATQVILEGDSG